MSKVAFQIKQSLKIDPDAEKIISEYNIFRKASTDQGQTRYNAPECLDTKTISILRAIHKSSIKHTHAGKLIAMSFF